MMYPHQMYGSQLGHHSPATPGSMTQLFSSSTPLAGAMPPSGSSSGLGLGLSASGSGLAVPTPIRPCKRSISDDSTDDEMDHKSLQLADSNMEGNCHLMSRKKRRGLIEKRRRDRINNSLHELKRLVPAAFEKQGSAKLEKAEILQLTVDHLRMLHSKGFDAFSFDPHKFATDYHLIGFREAATEVARYLAVHEGIDFQDPLRLRLMTHLHTYSSQRELSLKSCTGWNPSLFTTPMYPPLATGTGASTSGGSAASSSGTLVPSSSTTPSTVSGSGSGSHQQQQQQQQLQSSHNSSGNASDASQLLHNSSSGSSSQQQQHSAYSSASYNSSTGYSSLDGSSMMAGSSGSSGSSAGSQLNGSGQQVVNGLSAKSPSAFTGYSSGSGAVLPSTASTALPSAVASSYASYAPYAAAAAGAHYFAPTASYMPPMVHSHAAAHHHHHAHHHAPGVPGGANNGALNGSANGSSAQSSVKHYRPWGTELAY